MNITEHIIHIANIDCASCHSQSVVSYDSCHFETEVNEHVNRFYGRSPRHGFVYLVNGADATKRLKKFYARGAPRCTLPC